MPQTPTSPLKYPSSLWVQTAINDEPHGPLMDAIDADVTIIGAGFTGLRAALALAESGTKVVVLEAGDVAYGASGRNGGQVNPMLPFNTPAKLKKILGDRYFEKLTETSLASADELFSLIKTYQIDCQARQKGWLRVVHNKRSLKDAEAGVQQWNRFGAGMEIIDGNDLKQRSGTDAYIAGVVTPKGGAVQPMSLARGLARAAKDQGAEIFGGSAVLSLERSGSKWISKTAHGEVKSDWVIVATNAYSDDLIPKLAKTIIPVTPIQIATDPLPEGVISSVLPEGHTISDSRRVIMYARREPDNRIVYGGLGSLQPDGKVLGADWLKKDAARVFPQLESVAWTYEWGGHIAITDDHLPHMHEPKPGLLIGLGYNGRGVAMSNVMGRVLAERVLGASPEALPFPVSPIQPMPNRQVKLWGMGTAIWFMRLLDYIETR